MNASKKIPISPSAVKLCLIAKSCHYLQHNSNLFHCVIMQTTILVRHLPMFFLCMHMPTTRLYNKCIWQTYSSRSRSKVYSMAASSLQHKTMLTERIALLQQMLLPTMKVALVWTEPPMVLSPWPDHLLPNDCCQPGPLCRVPVQRYVTATFIPA